MTAIPPTRKNTKAVEIIFGFLFDYSGYVDFSYFSFVSLINCS